MKFFHFHADSLGFAASLLCALHCALMPLVLSLSLYSGATWLLSPWLEWAFIGASFGIASWALLRGYRWQHGHWQALALAGIGFTLLLLGRQAAQAHIFSATGGVLIAGVHYFNWQWQHRTCRQPLSKQRISTVGKWVLSLLLVAYLLGVRSACTHTNTPPTRAEVLQVVWKKVDR